jgi:hypothetical protein
LDKICIGIPAYGSQFPNWWTTVMASILSLSSQQIQVDRILSATSMATDTNRNFIVKNFLECKADWLMWIDTDNNLPIRGIRRLLDNQKTLVTGLYFKKDFEKPTPVAYVKAPSGGYTDIPLFNLGEIVPIDCAGMGMCLTHRSVYEDIEKNCEVMSFYGGGLTPILKSDIQGSLPDKFTSTRHRVKNGELSYAVRKEKVDIFPYFVQEHTRTEDMIFYELAKAAGHPAWLDTGVVSDHLGVVAFNGKDWRNWLYMISLGEETVYRTSMGGEKNVTDS